MEIVSKQDTSENIALIMGQLKYEVISFLGGPDVVEHDLYVQEINTKKYSGAVLLKNDFTLSCFFKNLEGEKKCFNFHRKFPFTKLEMILLNELMRGMHALVSKSEPGKHKAHFRAAFISSAFEIAIARMLRSEDNNFWNLQLLIQHLKSFSFTRYESQPCTIGFLYTNNPQQTKKLLSAKKEIFIFKDLSKKERVKVNSIFFESILAYRYVDGVRSIYVVDTSLNVIGILELQIKNYTSNELRNHSSFLSAIPDIESFCIFVTKKSEIDILLHQGNLLRWRKGKWSQVNKEIMKNLLKGHFKDVSDLDLLIEIVVAMSASNQGAIVLLPQNDKWSFGDASRHVDKNSKIAKILRKFRLENGMRNLLDLGILTSILSTDGMTVIDSHGDIVDASALIKLENDETGKGGGRSAAAKMASKHGITIKVSEDGPIQIYKDKILLVEIN